MILHTTIRPLLVATLFCLPLCATLLAEEGVTDGLDLIEQVTESSERPNEIADFTDNDAGTDELGQGVAEENDGTASEKQTLPEDKPLSPSDESSPEPTPPADEQPSLDDNQSGELPHATGKKNIEQLPQEQKDKVPATWLQDLNNFSFLKDSCPVLLDKLSASVWFQLQTVGAMVVIPFMAYKTLVHLKQIFTDKEKQRGKHILRSFLYGTSGIITLNALIQYMQTLKDNETAQI